MATSNEKLMAEAYMALWIYKAGLEHELTPDEELKFIWDYAALHNRPKF
jgi:hypothetical protein